MSKVKYCPRCGDRPPRYMSVETAALEFDLTESALRSMIKRREISYEKLGNRIRIEYSALRRQLIHYPAVDEFSLQSINLESNTERI